MKYLESKKLDWIFQSKSNRKIKIRGRWTTLNLISLSYAHARTMQISGNTYSVWEVEGRVKGIGPVKVIVSEGMNGKRYYVTNRKDWNAKRILESYLRRWDVEVIHRELKQEGLGHIFLRKLCKTELYLRLIVTGRVLLEISSIRSLSAYPSLDDSVEKKERWISVELLRSLAELIKRYGNHFIDALEASITNPYRSARKVFRKIYSQNGI